MKKILGLILLLLLLTSCSLKMSDDDINVDNGKGSKIEVSEKGVDVKINNLEKEKVVISDSGIEKSDNILGNLNNNEKDAKLVLELFYEGLNYCEKDIIKKYSDFYSEDKYGDNDQIGDICFFHHKEGNLKYEILSLKELSNNVVVANVKESNLGLDGKGEKKKTHKIKKNNNEWKIFIGIY